MVESKTIYHFFLKAKMENTTTTAKMLEGKGQWKWDIKVIEVKGQDHYAILLVRKVHFILFMNYLS